MLFCLRLSFRGLWFGCFNVIVLATVGILFCYCCCCSAVLKRERTGGEPLAGFLEPYICLVCFCWQVYLSTLFLWSALKLNASQTQSYSENSEIWGSLNFLYFESFVHMEWSHQIYTQIYGVKVDII